MPRRKFLHIFKQQEPRKMLHTVLQFSAHKLMEQNNVHDDGFIRSRMKLAERKGWEMYGTTLSKWHDLEWEKYNGNHVQMGKSKSSLANQVSCVFSTPKARQN